LRDLPHQKIPRELCGGEDPAIFSMSHVPMERFFDGTNQENSKNQERKNGGKKKGFFFVFNIHGGSHTHVFSIGWECPQLLPVCNPPLGEPTWTGTSPYNLWTI